VDIVRFIDSHLHLPLFQSPQEVLRDCVASETLLWSAAVDRASSAANLDLARRSSAYVHPFVGVHPSEAARGMDLAWLEGLLEQATGLGEVGLDPKYSEVAEGSPQMRILQTQIELAERKDKPVQVHTRDTARLCLEKLSSYRLRRVLLHWFEGEDEASTAAGRGYYISVGPAVLYSKKVVRVAATYPEDLILPESDGPLAFQALSGAGGPLLIPSVVFGLAQLRHRSFGEMAESLLNNGRSFLG
jgi:TatD DNase family protein